MKMNRIFFMPLILIVFLWGNPAYSLETGWNELHQQAAKLCAQKKYSACLKTYEKLLGLTQAEFGEDNVRVAKVLVEMSLVYRYGPGNEKEYARLQEQAKKIQLTLNGTVNCQTPKDWSYGTCTERWLGHDPCFVFRNVDDYIKVTYYGLDGSRFKKPDDFIQKLTGLFKQFNAREVVQIDGRETTRVILRYEQGNDHDHHGSHRLPAFLYEEFLILPLRKGFLVFNFKLNHNTPLPSDFSRENAPTDLYGDSYDTYRVWMSFINSCKINR